MGEVANAMLDGTLCSVCGVHLGGDEGYPVTCRDCDSEHDRGKAKRASNREYGHAKLTELKIPFESKNNGAHLIVTGPDGLIDFWPATGKFKIRATGESDRGIRKLIKHVQEEVAV